MKNFDQNVPERSGKFQNVEKDRAVQKLRNTLGNGGKVNVSDCKGGEIQGSGGKLFN